MRYILCLLCGLCCLPYGNAQDSLDLVYVVAEQMPIFPNDCSDSSDLAERKRCSDLALIRYIGGRIKYNIPDERHFVEGVVLVEFVVGKEGLVRDIRVLKSPHGYWTTEVIRVIETMNSMSERWAPGRRGGVPVSVKLTLPIRIHSD